jgi:hypothetical protein
MFAASKTVFAGRRSSFAGSRSSFAARVPLAAKPDP